MRPCLQHCAAKCLAMQAEIELRAPSRLSRCVQTVAERIGRKWGPIAFRLYYGRGAGWSPRPTSRQGALKRAVPPAMPATAAACARETVTLGRGAGCG